MELEFKFDKIALAAMAKRIESLGGKVKQQALKALDSATDKLLEESVKRCPIDEGFLQQSHDKKVEKSGSLDEAKGTVFIPANSPAADYAIYMHELEYNLGPQSQAKQDAQPGIIVGNKYLERAFEDNKKAFFLFFEDALRKAIAHA